MSAAELNAAGIFRPDLRQAYTRCRRLNSAHGKTYFLATRLLAPRQRPAVHALYGFARWADDIVDDVAADADVASRAARLADVANGLRAGLRHGEAEHPVLAAVVDTARRYQVDEHLFEDFLCSMRMDLELAGYPDRIALERYTRGSAEVIGLQVLPVLGTAARGRPATDEAAPHAAALGKAFQLTNFLRDIAEDLDRGRVYLPADELAAFGVDRHRLAWCRRRGRADRAVREALAFQHDMTRQVYRFAARGIPLLHPVSRPCVHTALVLYSEILDKIEGSGFEVFDRRVSVRAGRKATVAAGAFGRVLRARHADRASGGIR